MMNYVIIGNYRRPFERWRITPVKSFWKRLCGVLPDVDLEVSSELRWFHLQLELTKEQAEFLIGNRELVVQLISAIAPQGAISDVQLLVDEEHQ